VYRRRILQRRRIVNRRLRGPGDEDETTRNKFSTAAQVGHPDVPKADIELQCGALQCLVESAMAPLQREIHRCVDSACGCDETIPTAAQSVVGDCHHISVCTALPPAVEQGVSFIKLSEKENIRGCVDGIMAGLDSQRSVLADMLDTVLTMTEPREMQATITLVHQRLSHLDQMVEDLCGDLRKLWQVEFLAFEAMLSQQAQATAEMVRVMHAERDQVEVCMHNVVEDTAHQMQDQREAFAKAQHAEFEDNMSHRQRIEEELLAERLSSKAAQHRELEKLQAEEHARHSTLRRDLASELLSLTCQLSTARTQHIVAKDVLRVNCAMLEERQLAFKTTLMQQRRTIHSLSATLSGLKARHAANKKQAEQEKASMLADAEKLRNDQGHLRSKAAHFAVADEKEVRTFVESKRNHFAVLFKRFAGAESVLAEHAKHQTLTQDMSLVADIKSKGPITVDEARSQHDVLIPAIIGRQLAGEVLEEMDGSNAAEKGYWRSLAGVLLQSKLKHELCELQQEIKKELELGGVATG
jgi:RNase H-fold protein (predicted Holliday junction resolvase)